MSTKKYLDPEGMLKLVENNLKKFGRRFSSNLTCKYLELSAKNIEAAIHAHDHGMTVRGPFHAVPQRVLIPMVSLPFSTSCTPRS